MPAPAMRATIGVGLLDDFVLVLVVLVVVEADTVGILG